MQANKKIRGMGRSQIDQMEGARKTVLLMLADGEWHQYGELKEKSKLSSATLTKHLKQLDIMEKKLDTESGKYPYPVYYRIKPEYQPAIEVIEIIEQEKEEIKQIILDPKKDPLDVLDQINRKNNSSILSILKLYKENRKISSEFVDVTLELFVWQPYRILTSFLIEESKKIIEKIDVNYLIESNNTTMYLDKNSLKSLGLTEDEIDDIERKYGNIP